MSRQEINIGAAPNDGTGDNLRTGGDKINQNFIELYRDKVDKQEGKQLTDQNYTLPEKQKLSGLPSSDSLSQSLASKADAQATANALADKVDRVAGKGLSTNDYTTADKDKVGGVESGAQKNPGLATIAEAQAGAEAGLRSWSPVRIHNAINGWYGATIKSIIDGLKQGSRMDVAGLNERNSGLLLQTGAGGWMGDVPVGINNIDDKTVRGWRYVVEATAGTKPPGVSYGHVLTFGNTSDAVNQEFWEISGASGVTLRKFMRTTFGTGAWGPWVSLSIESGNNSNGYYSRFPDGTQICVTNQKTRPAGGTVLSFEWPASFLSGTRVISYPQVVPSSTWELPTGWYANINNGMMYFASGAASVNGCEMVGIGRWKV